MSPEGTTVAHSVCPHDCPSVCPLDVDIGADGRVGRVRGANNPYTDGIVCAKVARYAERLYHPERLLHPLKRVGPKGSGKFAAISWDAALDEITARFTKIAEEWGPQAIWPFVYGGTMGLVQRDGINRLRRAAGWSMQGGTICVGISRPGWWAGMGDSVGTDPRDMIDSDVIVVWGGNPVSTQVHVMDWVAKARRARGAKLVVIDPYRTATAEKADLHLMPKPGTDAALACAVMHVLFAEGMADRDWMARFTDVPDELEAHVATRTPAWASAITGIPVEQILAFARLYGGTKRSFIRVGYGFSRSRTGAASMHAVACLPSVTGAWAHEGGGALHSVSGATKLDMSFIEGHAIPGPLPRSLDMVGLGRVLAGVAPDVQGGPPVKALLVQNCNPAAVCPESLLVRDGLLRDDLFVVVHEHFMTDTARLADIILPATMMLEHDDVYKAGGHFFTQVHRAVVPAAGECRSNHELYGALAERLGLAHKHPAFTMTAWQVVEETLRLSHLPTAERVLQERWLDKAPTDGDRRFSNGFPHADGKFHFAADWAGLGDASGQLPRLPDWVALIDHATAEQPFRLITPPARSFLNTSFTESAKGRGLEGEPTVKIHPEDCIALNVVAGDWVTLGNQRGAVTLKAHPFDGVQRGVVVVEGIWPNTAFREGIGINALTSADVPAPAGGAVFHDTSVWISPH